MTLKPQNSIRPPAIGNRLFRNRDAKDHSWSEDWPFAGRRRAAGPSETFSCARGQARDERHAITPTQQRPTG